MTVDSEILTALRLSLRATRSSAYTQLSAATVEEAPPPKEDDVHKRIVLGIVFSRSFILSYQIVLLVLLLLFAARHWTSRFRSWRRRPPSDPDWWHTNFSTHRSSSSSTSNGDKAAPVNNHDLKHDECSPLLGHGQEKRSSSRLGQLRDRAKGWLMHQPRPIPVVNKTLPSNGCTVLILAFLGLQVFYVFYKLPLSIPMLFVFADRTALLFVANLPLLYLLAAKNQPIKVLTGYSYECLNIFHRRLGEVLCLLALLHSIGMIGVWYTILRPTGFTLARFLLSKIILLGLGALFAYETLYFTSLGSFRQRWYELFLGLHVVLQAAALVLVWLHHHGSRPYVGAALFVFVIDRCLYRSALRTTTTRATFEVADDGKTVLLHATVPLHKRRRWLGLIKPDITNGWKATEHVFLSVPSLARKHYIQAHPFTIASKAPTILDSNGRLALVVRAHDGFSKDLLHFAKSYNSAVIRLDGPYGSQNAVRLLQGCDLRIVVAGGSGVAVTWPLVWSVLESRNPTDFEHVSETSFKPVIFIWIMRQGSHVSWIGRKNLERLTNAGVEALIFPPTVDHGQPDLSGSIRSWIARQDGFSLEPSTIGIVSSGPDGMNRSVRNLAASLVSAGHNVNVEIEKFGW